MDIVAISTALSRSAISITRLCGSNALNIAKNIVDKPLIPRVATLCNAYDKDGNLIDKLICIYFKAPNSFNGEDIVEFQSHGGVVIAREILKLCIDLGARVALPGEFSKIALLNNKMDMIEIEALNSAINSTNTNLNKAFMRNANGELKKLLDFVREKIVQAIAQIEVNIDYSEEDLDNKILQNTVSDLGNIKTKFNSILESTKIHSKLQNIKLSIIGKPNVGKSSILNLLLSHNRAIVSNIAGTTRDIITEIIDIDGNLIQIIDTAGIRESGDTIENMGIEKSMEVAKISDILLCVFDSSTEMEIKDYEILDFATSQNAKVFIILNKNDLEKKIDFLDFKGNYKDDIISINTLDSLSNNSNQILREKISAYLNGFNKDELILMNSIQENVFLDSVKCIEKSIIYLQDNKLELASFELNEILKNIATFTKPYDNDEVLDSMFSQFCVGK